MSLDNILVMDKQPADDGKSRNLNQWRGYWDEVNDGRAMASKPDQYAHFKQLKEKYEKGDDSDKKLVMEELKSIRRDFKESWLVYNTEYDYNGDNLETRITHHKDCAVPGLTKEITVEVPVYRGTPIAEVTGKSEGLSYLQADLDTEDDGETIIKVLEFGSGKGRSDIRIWTPSQDYRASHPERAAGLSYGGGDFRVNGDGLLNYDGRSRGVFKSPAGAARGKLAKREFHGLDAYQPVSEIVGALSHDGSSILDLHFRNSVDNLGISDGELRNIAGLYGKSKDKDDSSHRELVRAAMDDFKKKHGFWKRLFRLVEFEEPSQSYSLLTQAAKYAVEVGGSLNDCIARLNRFPEHINKMVARAERLADEEADLTDKMCRIQETLQEYSHAIETTLSFMDELRGYDLLNNEGQEKSAASMNNAYGGCIHYEDETVRANLVGILDKHVFAFSQLGENAESDLKNFDQMRESVYRQRNMLKKNIERFWKLYNPVREAAVKLHTTFRELAAQVEDGELLCDVDEVIMKVPELCSAADKSAAALEMELSASTETALSIYKMEQELHNPDMLMGRERARGYLPEVTK